jgi:hypothetical protein
MVLYITYSSPSTGTRIQLRYYIQSQHPEDPTAPLVQQDLVCNKVNINRRQTKGGLTNVNFFSSSTICIRSVLLGGCAATMPFGEVDDANFDGNDNGGVAIPAG